MKILITNDLSNAMEKQPKDILSAFIESIDKLQELVKPQILLLENVVDLSSPDDETKLYAYNISGKSCSSLFIAKLYLIRSLTLAAAKCPPYTWFGESFLHSRGKAHTSS